jgi:acetyl-CoA acetyltransferase
MEDVYVIGVGMTAFGRHLDRSVQDLAREAVTQALGDAGCATADVRAVYFSNTGQGALEGQHMVRGQIALRALGLGSVPVVNVENACASGSTAFHLACMQVRAGAADLVLAVGAEKMCTIDKNQAFGLLMGAQDVHGGDALRRSVRDLAREGADAHDSRANHSIFMDVYAGLAKQHMRLYGSTPTMFASVTAKNRSHAQHNPRAQYRTPCTVEEVLGARSIAWPLTLPMCSPVSDGAAAAVLCSAAALRRLGGRKAVKVLASVLASGSDRDVDDLDRHITRQASRLAYERAGVGPSEMSLAEVHDATAVGEVIQVENLGLCEPGRGGELATVGATSIGGRIPVNPSGGLECKGHPIGATGLGQIHELVTQLRGEAGARQVTGARLAIAENGGGFLGYEEAAACITILGQP